MASSLRRTLVHSVLLAAIKTIRKRFLKIDYQQPPDGSQQPPDGSQQPPDDSQQAPDDSQQPPDDSQQAPDGSQQLPDDSQQLPDDSQQRFGEGALKAIKTNGTI